MGGGWCKREKRIEVASGLGDRGDRGAFSQTRNATGRAIVGRRAELDFGCFTGRGDEHMGLVCRLGMEVGIPREDPGLSVLGWSPWPDMQHRGADDACRCDGYSTVTQRPTEAHLLPLDTILCCPVPPSLLGLFFTFKFSSQTGRVHWRKMILGNLC